MTANVSDPRIPGLREQRRKEQSSLIWYNIRKALTGQAGASPNAVPTTGLADGYVWTHGNDNRPEVPALHCGRVSLRASNADILIGNRWTDGELEVITLDGLLATLRYGGAIGAIATPDVPKELQPFGGALDALRVRVFQSGTLLVNAGGGWYEDDAGNEKRWTPTLANALDLSSNVPAAVSSVDQQRWVLITLDPTAGAETLTATNGTAQSIGAPLLKSDIESITFPAGHKRLCAVILQTGDTDETDLAETDFEDLRFWLLGSADDEKVKVSANDTTANYLLSKLTAGSGITLTETNNGGNETITVEATGGAASAEPYAQIEDQKTQNTAGGSITSGGWRTRTLNTKAFDASVIASITKLAFTSGGTYEVVVGDTITGATSAATATVFDVELTSGTWAGGDAAGNLWLNSQSGTFQSENLNVGANTNVATIAANSTGNQVRLKTATYRFSVAAPAHRVNAHQARLQNITDGTTVKAGQQAFDDASASEANSFSFVDGRMTLAAAKTFEVQHQVTTTNASAGGGTVANFTTEVYTVMRLWKEA
jgi:hypothetical protein